MKMLKSLRNTKGVSQTEVAKYLGISRQAYSFYETGVREASYETLLKLGEYFECTLDYLVRGTSDSVLPGVNKDIPQVLVIPDTFSDVLFAFSDGEHDGLNQDEVDRLAAYVETIKKTATRQGQPAITESALEVGRKYDSLSPEKKLRLAGYLDGLEDQDKP